METILRQLLTEREMKYKGGLYHLTQVKLTYNTNRIEGSCLSEEQTRLIFETQSLLSEQKTAISVNDIIETQNHFLLFDYMLDHALEPLSEKMIKEYHRILKSSTSDSRLKWFAVGDYKRVGNVVANLETTPPNQVPDAMRSLLEKYNCKSEATFHDIVDFHYHFERIHPFQDGNGRIGRIIMFKECLKNNITPFIIEDEKKAFYYRGLSEYLREPGYLIDTCLDAQDHYEIYWKQLKFD